MKWVKGCMALVLAGASGVSVAAEDPGKAKIGWVEVAVYHASNTAPKKAPDKGKGKKTPKPVLKAVPEDIIERMRGVTELKFKHYTLLGRDIQPLLRSYESWAHPLKPSDEVLVRFEAQGRPTRKTAILDLELWLARRKTIKMDVRLEGTRPLCVLGPEYRGGRLIIAVALASKPKSAP
jgi:hypothetical protein